MKRKRKRTLPYDTRVVHEIEGVVLFDTEPSNDQINLLVGMTMHKMEYRAYTDTHTRTIQRIVMYILDRRYSIVSREERNIIKDMVLANIHIHLSQKYTYTPARSERTCVCVVA